MGSVKIILRKDKRRKSGSIPLYLRITHGRISTLVSLQISVDENNFDTINERVKKSSANYKVINAILSKKKAEAESILLKSEFFDTGNIREKVKIEIKGKTTESFFEFVEEYLKRISPTTKIATYKQYDCAYHKLKKFCGDKNLRFCDITISFLRNYEKYLIEILKNKGNTPHNSMKYIRKFINNAIEEGIYEGKNPFKNFKLKRYDSKREILTEAELNKIESLILPANSTANHHRNAFVFACYAGGLRISDICTLKYSDIIENKRICLKSRKTGKQLFIPLPNKAIEILSHYANKTNTDSFIFPFLKLNPNCSDEKLIFEGISQVTAHANKNLKKICSNLGIKKSISFHCSRHTWATRAISKGMHIAHVSKILGHSSIKTTQIYLRIIDLDLEKAMEAFNY